MDFWQWVAIIGLALTAIGVGLGVIALALSGRQQGSLATLIAGAEERTKTTMAQMDSGLKQVLDRIDERAEQRYRDLKDRLDGEAEDHGP
jgi:hypothetical protein